MHPHTGLTARASSGDGEHGGDLNTDGRLAVDIRRLPWIKRLAADYAFDFARVGGFFAGNPGDPAAWRDAVARAAERPRDREGLVGLLVAQQQSRGAPAEALAAAEQLRDPRSVAVVTGQQAGLFGGPLYTLLKALTAIRLAEQIRTEQQVPAVAVFWVDAEDHDWDEVKGCGLLDRDMTPQSVSVGNPPGAHAGPVARVQLDESVTAALTALEACLPPTEFTPALLEDLRQAYRPGAGMASAFAQWLDHVLGPRGLIVFDASDVAAKPLVARVFAHEVEHAGDTSRLVHEAGAALTALGYHAQVTPQADNLALFHLGVGREPIRIQGDGFLVGERTESKEQLLARIQQFPSAFSPNVLLRPLVQDTLFPTACYVAGPSELAYLGQLKGVYDAFQIPMPLVCPRSSATLIDSNGMRFLARYGVPLEALRAQDDGPLNQLLQAQLPPSVEAAIQEASGSIEKAMTRLAAEVPHVDATLEGAARSTLGRMQDDLKKLHSKVIQAAKRKDDTLRRQYRHAQAQAFPGGQPQEREVAFVCFLNRYGPTVVDRLHDALPLDPGTHWVLTI